MSSILIQSTSDTVTLYVETTSGAAAEDLTASDVQVDLRKAGEAFFTNKPLTDATDATADIGSGANGTVTVAVPGTAGNSYTVEVTVPAGTSALTVTKSGTDLTVALAVSSGVPITAENTATQIADSINALDSEIEATASGTGADSLSSAEGPAALSGGADGTWTDVGLGFYNLTLSTDDTDTLGTLYLRLSGPSVRPQVEQYTVATAVSSSPTPTVSVTTTSIFGYLLKADGTAYEGASVAARVLSSPTILHPGTEGLLLEQSLVTTSTDSDGFFTISLIAGSTVEVFIPAGNYKRTIVVPSASTNLFDIS